MSRYPALICGLLLAVASCAPRTEYPPSPPSAQSPQNSGKPRWVVAHPSAYAEALAPLKRSRILNGYEVISLTDPDPAKIAAAVQRLRLGSRGRDCLLLVGSQRQVPSLAGQHGRMAGIASDGKYGIDESKGRPLFPVGRLPADSPSDARHMVAKIRSFEKSSASRRRDAVLLVGNPMGDRTPVADLFITSISKGLMKRADASWTFHGAADVGGHPLEVPSADFPSRFRTELSREYAIGTYFGHSNDSMFAVSGRNFAFLSSDWRNIPGGGNRGLFLSCGCYSLQHPQAGGYQAMRSAGGPVAYIGATGETYAAMGYLAAHGLMDSLTDNPPGTVGEWWLEVQEAIASKPINPVVFTLFDHVDGSSGLLPFSGVPLRKQRREHLEMWMLLGDPATRLF